MSRFASAVRLDLLLQLRYGFYYAAVFVALLWIALLYPLPDSVLDFVASLVVFTDLAVVGYYFIGGMVLFEKGEATLSALVITPLRFREYLASKLVTHTALAVVLAFVVVAASAGFGFDVGLLVLGVVLTSLVTLLAGFIIVAPFDSVSAYLIPSQLPMVVMALPLIHFFGVWKSPIFYLFPTQGSLLLLGGAFDPGSLAAWQILYAIFYGLAWVFGLGLLARWAFERHVVGQGR